MHRFQTYWKHHADVPFPCFTDIPTALAVSGPGYFRIFVRRPTADMARDASTRIEVGAGETIMQHHLINLYKLMDMWDDTPGMP